MIFVSVGTHEQPFNRLLREVERLVSIGNISDVVIQYGYSTIQPKGCFCKMFLSYDEMRTFYSKADVIVCHGGPSTFMEAISFNKIPVVVPRQMNYHEHVNNHQLAFAEQFSKRVGGIKVVEDIAELGAAIDWVANEWIEEKNTNNARFCDELSKLIERLY